MMKRLRTVVFGSFPSGRLGVSLGLFRVFTGCAFIYHGLAKLGRLEHFADKWHLSYGVALSAALTQLIGGILLIPGMLTIIGALGITTTMAAATIMCIEKGESFSDPDVHSWESAIVYVVIAVALAIAGPGSYSVDALVFGRAADDAHSSPVAMTR